MRVFDWQRALRVGNHRLNHLAFSPDAQRIAVVSDQGLTILSLTGDRLLDYPPFGSMALQQVALLADPERCILGAASGEVYELELPILDQPELVINQLPAPISDDLASMAVFAAAQRDHELIALGHRAAALTMLNLSSAKPYEWRKHADDRTALSRQNWLVAFAPTGDTLYAVSRINNSNHLCAFASADGREQYPKRILRYSVTALAVTADHTVIVNERMPPGGRITAYSPDLTTIRWSCEEARPISAFAAGHTSLALAVGGNGTLRILDTSEGVDLATPHTLQSFVRGLAYYNDEFVAAITDEHEFALFELIEA
jgi:hypothetical protein